MNPEKVFQSKSQYIFDNYSYIMSDFIKVRFCPQKLWGSKLLRKNVKTSRWNDRCMSFFSFFLYAVLGSEARTMVCQLPLCDISTNIKDNLISVHCSQPSSKIPQISRYIVLKFLSARSLDIDACFSTASYLILFSFVNSWMNFQ